ncbi:2-C-methyl-D-erythritol 2,4-cyclodiphosphate synthase [Fervidibacillus halotolerans]|uniref:2-C-methyl-D-erythritol 2,4-cyclodiphosphate synthase n=1 Tax=Fervidibacillus halotolerans TaxID=2980027 RepID=A0A9E8M0J6_9BACI|nr:2-C-methyl-D-erythritol 2,4-cyclodiphosphate synthase [Fervidibacillus halotolerans]WAA12371.1 2-C-methyl-D-erythritol 2,4-cyclodiphosphate synthase [Fervidibacillus halotolerans]
MFRIGQGFDVHRFADGRPLIIGGVNIPFEKGLSGHSDADVLLHALTDAILGAVGLVDIGTHFPDTDPSYKNADSAILLKKVWKLVKEKGFTLGNADCTLICERPKMGPYREQIKDRIASILEVERDQINVKATTTEKLGFTGREEGIAALAVVLLEKQRERES